MCQLLELDAGTAKQQLDSLSTYAQNKRQPAERNEAEKTYQRSCSGTSNTTYPRSPGSQSSSTFPSSPDSSSNSGAFPGSPDSGSNSGDSPFSANESSENSGNEGQGYCPIAQLPGVSHAATQFNANAKEFIPAQAPKTQQMRGSEHLKQATEMLMAAYAHWDSCLPDMEDQTRAHLQQLLPPASLATLNRFSLGTKQAEMDSFQADLPQPAKVPWEPCLREAAVQERNQPQYRQPVPSLPPGLYDDSEPTDIASTLTTATFQSLDAVPYMEEKEIQRTGELLWHQEAAQDRAFLQLQRLGIPCSPTMGQGQMLQRPTRAYYPGGTAVEKMGVGGALAGSHRQQSWAATQKGKSLRSNLQELQNVESERVVLVRRINGLGFESPETLKKYFSKYGTVVRVLVAHSHVKTKQRGCGSRLRPSGIGFAVMGTKEQAQAILADGPEHLVKGPRVHTTVPIRVQSFEFRMDDKVDEEGDEGDDGDDVGESAETNAAILGQ